MPNYSSALQEWKQTLGEGNVICDTESIGFYTQNVGGLEGKIPAVIKPHSLEEVQQLILIANRYETPLWAFSTGRNWGLGSRLPVKDDCVVVDLHEMNRIREINTLHGYVVIEPGVTQGLLWDYLNENNLPFVFDATGSGRDTSIIGNQLIKLRKSSQDTALRLLSH